MPVMRATTAANAETSRCVRDFGSAEPDLFMMAFPEDDVR
jgi:hypothetical protein